MFCCWIGLNIFSLLPMALDCVCCVCMCVCVCVFVCGGDMCVHVCEGGVSLCIHVATPVCSCTYVALYVPRSSPPRDLVTFVKSGRQRIDNRGRCHIVFMSSFEKQLGADCAFRGLGCECILLNICIKALPLCAYHVCLHNVTRDQAFPLCITARVKGCYMPSRYT